MLPLDILKQYLLQVEETQLLELLDLKSEDLVERFADRIKERRAYLAKEVELMQEIDQSQAEDYLDEDMDDL
jgi:hypothetical protein